ncbi:UNVERIFIED_CONTAM: Pentatricopeptide repeat-containing protein, mitochondrial [Sesamum radiatum]|uniref:Pentatricopeptide repeat-containing protein, mitochondrial n=1 Tax=Sesamum radiatum TaxID=300843 RepID=A0AAW2K1W6_SESRA
MALRSKLRSVALVRHRLFSTSILSPDSKTPLSSKEKSRAALSLLRFEKNPERILDICRAAALTPESHLDRVAYSRPSPSSRNPTTTRGFGSSLRLLGQTGLQV